MKIEIAFLRSKVARRIFLLFILSSLLPVLLLAFLSLRQVNVFTTNQQHEHLKEISKNYGLSLLDRFLFLKTKINWVAQILIEENLPINLNMIRGFKSIKAINFNGTKNIIYTLNDSEKLLTLIKTEINHLKSGNSIIISDYFPHLSSKVFLFRLIDKNYPEKGILIGEIDLSYLWGDIDSLGSEINLCVIDESNRALFCSHGEQKLDPNNLIKINQYYSGSFTWYDSNNEELISNYWSIFLEPNFAVKKWTVITSKLKYNILLPISDFKNIFALVMLLTITIVAFFSIHQIRKNLIPIEKIMDGIKYLSNKDFKHTVEVDSGDEFEDLANSFNKMAARIDKQFHTLSTMSDIDQLILSNLRIEDIIRIVLSRMHEIVSFDSISMTIIDHNNHSSCRTYINDEFCREKITVHDLEITLEAYQKLIENKYIIITNKENLPGYFSSVKMLDNNSFLIVPGTIKDEVSIVIGLGYKNLSNFTEEDILLVQDFTNHVAVAVSNATWEEQLYHMAHYDSLTGLPNRMLMRDRLQQNLAKSERKKSFLAVLFIDLDRFKYVNDSLGHLAGDLLLCSVSKRLIKILRAEDTISRFGGDEFVVLISNFQSIHELLSVTTTIAKKVIADLSKPFDINNYEIHSTASIGIACYPNDGQTANELLKNADSAMYYAKSNGKNNYQFYSKVLNAEALERLELENSLHHALDRCEFEIYYQPKIETRSRKICGAEALLRWNHPQKGWISPAQFIPIAEELGLIIPIGEWIIHTVCTQVKSWQSQGFSSLRVAINLSPLQFRHSSLIKNIRNALDLIGLSPSTLEFEITEGAAMTDVGHTIKIMNTFKNMGLYLSIDDFGTGYSSLSYLKRFPIDTLKIDQSFVRNLGTSSEDMAIVRSIIALAHSLNLSVVAEGVETEEQFDYLYNHECNEIQGYLFSPPIPADKFTKLLNPEAISYNGRSPWSAMENRAANKPIDNLYY